MIKVPAILSGASLTHDKGMRLSFVTQEMSNEEKLEATKHHDAFGYLLFAENAISTSDLPKEQAEDRSKSPSKRLRSVLYVLYQQTAAKDDDFEVWYRNRMEKIIDLVKAKLD